MKIRIGIFFQLFIMIFTPLKVSGASNLHPIKLFDFYSHAPTDCQTDKDPCYDIQDLISQALQNGLESREKVIELFQYKQNVKNKRGMILPQINIVQTAVAALDKSPTIESTIPLVGFIFPNRWFDYSKAKRLKEAEEESLITLFANRALEIQRLYFYAQSQIWTIKIYKFYIKELNRLIDFLKNHKKTISDEDIAILQNIRGEFIYKLSFTDALSSVLPSLATAIGLSPHKDWAKLKIKPYSITTMSHEQKRDYLDFWPQAFVHSTELKGIKFLIKAAKYNKKSIFYDIIDPASGNEIGFSYGPRIKIARSEIKKINIFEKRTQMQLSNALQNALNNYNDSIDSFAGIEIALDALEHMRQAVEKDINDPSRPLDINRIDRYFWHALGRATDFISSFFIFHVSKAELERYTWEGEAYELVQQSRTTLLPQLLDDIKKELSFRQSAKNLARKVRRNKSPVSQQ